jgi:putative endonuclease
MNKLEYGLSMEEEALQWMLEHYPTLMPQSRNYRWKGGEIDLVFEDEETRELVFVEVRARQLDALVDPISSITYPKQRKLCRTIEHYLARYNGNAESVRIDFLGWDGENWIHLKNVILPVSSRLQ